MEVQRRLHEQLEVKHYTLKFTCNYVLQKSKDLNKFRFFIRFFYISFLLYFQNILIDTYLKYIKRTFKVHTSIYF